MCLCVAMAGYYTLKIRPNRNMLQGYANGDWWEKSGGRGDPRGRPKQTIAQCRAEAASRGYPGIGYRTDAHPSPEWRNTCFFFKNPDGGWSKTSSFGAGRGNDDDKAHVSGCTNPSKSWMNGC